MFMLMMPLMMSLMVAAKCNKWTNPSPRATFDLNGLALKDSFYKTSDTYLRSSRPFDYLFNLCTDIKFPPGFEKPCKARQDELGGKEVAAVQTQNVTSDGKSDAQCIVLGLEEKIQYSLLDNSDNNGVVGVQVVFDGGNKCRNDDATPRKFRLNIKCVKEQTTLNFLSTVSEDLDNGCEYEADIFSIYGCPTECHSSNHASLCSNHGVCGIDSEANKARCFCNAGWTNGDCSKQADDSSGPSSGSINTILIVLVLILLVMLLGLGYVLYGKIKALNADDVPYNALEAEGQSGNM